MPGFVKPKQAGQRSISVWSTVVRPPILRPSPSATAPQIRQDGDGAARVGRGVGGGDDGGDVAGPVLSSSSSTPSSHVGNGEMRRAAVAGVLRVTR